jgi:hypothetical protein
MPAPRAAMAHHAAADAAHTCASDALRLAQDNEAAIVSLSEAAATHGLAAQEAGDLARRLSEVALAHGQAVLALHALTSESLRLSAALHALAADFAHRFAPRGAHGRDASCAPGARRAAEGPPPPIPAARPPIGSSPADAKAPVQAGPLRLLAAAPPPPAAGVPRVARAAQPKAAPAAHETCSETSSDEEYSYGGPPARAPGPAAHDPRAAAGGPAGPAAAAPTEVPAPHSPMADYSRAASRSPRPRQAQGGGHRRGREPPRSAGPRPGGAEGGAGPEEDRHRREGRHRDGRRESRRADDRHAEPTRQGASAYPGAGAARCSIHPFITRTVRNMVPDGRGGMQCTPLHMCIIPCGHKGLKRVRTASERKSRRRSRSGDRRNHRQPPIA